jgi:E3 ubiquitin-protein ligase SIAH1
MRDCNYTGSYKNLYTHVRGKHKDDLVRFTWDTSLNVPWSLSKKIGVFQEENDKELIVVQVFSGLHGLTVSASCIAPLAPVQGIISCSMKLGNSAVRLKQALMLKKIQKVSDEEPEDGFMLIPSYLLPSDGNWKMRICISRGLTRVNHL